MSKSGTHFVPFVFMSLDYCIFGDTRPILEISKVSLKSRADLLDPGISVGLFRRKDGIFELVNSTFSNRSSDHLREQD